jgi:protein-S-isoprenylcysteine O-methyltransferase Ste14
LAFRKMVHPGMRFIYVKTRRAFALFLIQYAALAFLLLSGPVWPFRWYAWIFYLAGLVLGFWSLVAIGWNNLNAAPDVLPSGRMVTSGPYRWIRHPMYAALLLIFIPLVLTEASRLRILILAVLVINLFFKIRYEELQLKEMFTSYEEYSSTTWRLLPRVY